MVIVRNNFATYYDAYFLMYNLSPHRLRTREMSATEKWADELTKQAAGKHHIGDFLPPEELKK